MNSMNRPNSKYLSSNSSLYIGDNNIRRTFNDYFRSISIILSSGYDNYTNRSLYYNQLTNNGMSAYYVHQPVLEGQLEFEFLSPPVDTIKYLIGSAGVGKTTLVRTYFKVNDREIFFDSDGNLVAYLSFCHFFIQEMGNLSDIFVRYLKIIVNKYLEVVSFDVTSEIDMNRFYTYANKISSYDVVNEIVFGAKPLSKAERLNNFFRDEPLLAYTTFISFLAEEYISISKRKHKIILIFDDIESQKAEYHVPFIDEALNIFYNLKGNEIQSNNRRFEVKTLMVLRKNIFRYLSRHMEAYRINHFDVILMDVIPNIKDICIKRLEVYEHSIVHQKSANSDKLYNSIETLKIIIGEISSSYGEVISNLANNNIVLSFKLLIKILTNKKYFGYNESYYAGAFPEIKIENYPYISTIFLRAILYGENDVFVDHKDSPIPNILKIHSEENAGSELLTLYIMEYLCLLSRKKNITLYELNSIYDRDICSVISSILCINEIKSILLDKSLSYLIDRECVYGLYLSLRGNVIMNMLSENSILLSAFMDDIDTDIEEYNSRVSTNLSQDERLDYIIKYCNYLFNIEQIYIKSADKRRYFKDFGGGFIIERLLTGVYNSIKKLSSNETTRSRRSLNELRNRMKIYKTELEKNFDINITFSDMNVDLP